MAAIALVPPSWNSAAVGVLRAILLDMLTTTSINNIEAALVGVTERLMN